MRDSAKYIIFILVAYVYFGGRAIGENFLWELGDR
jgi:hypothetical protein